MSNKPLSILFLLISVFYAFTAEAANVTVQAKLDSVTLLMGKMTNVRVSVTQPRDAKGSFPLLGQIRDNGIIPVCGDSVELRAPSKIDSVVSGNSLTINYDIPVQAFDSGYYRLPEFEFVVGNDTARSGSLGLKVVPVLAEADTPVNDYASVSGPENPSIFDSVPDWIIDYWWLSIIIIIAALLFVYALRRYRREGSILPKKPQPTPYEAAMASLRKLKEAKLWEQGMEKEYYTDLTDILRKYLYGRFGINAVEMTSRQILASLSKNKETAGKRADFRQILDMADFVKFAKVRPLPDDNVLAFDNALRFVQETRPLPPVDDSEKESGVTTKTKKTDKKVRSGRPDVTANQKGGDR